MTHLNLMDIRDHEIENILSVKNHREKIENASAMGISLTVIFDKTILCALGVIDIYDRVCEIWMLPCKSILQHKLSFARTTKNLINQLWETGYYHRIQVTALADDFHNRYFSWLGFKLETPNGMKNFTIKKCTYNMWSRTN